MSDTTLGLLDELTNRLPPNDRLRFNTLARMKLSATIALGTARLMKELCIVVLIGIKYINFKLPLQRRQVFVFVVGEISHY